MSMLAPPVSAPSGAPKIVSGEAAARASAAPALSEPAPVVSSGPNTPTVPLFARMAISSPAVTSPRKTEAAAEAAATSRPAVRPPSASTVPPVGSLASSTMSCPALTGPVITNAGPSSGPAATTRTSAAADALPPSETCRAPISTLAPPVRGVSSEPKMVSGQALANASPAPDPASEPRPVESTAPVTAMLAPGARRTMSSPAVAAPKVTCPVTARTAMSRPAFRLPACSGGPKPVSPSMLLDRSSSSTSRPAVASPTCRTPFDWKRASEPAPLAVVVPSTRIALSVTTSTWDPSVRLA